MAYCWVDFLIFGEKTCPSCGRSRPKNAEHFHHDDKNRDGLTRECKKCRLARGTRRYASDPVYREKKLAQMRSGRERRAL